MRNKIVNKKETRIRNLEDIRFSGPGPSGSLSKNINLDEDEKINIMNLLEGIIEKVFTDITKSMIEKISSTYTVNDAALIDIWNKVNEENNNGLCIKLKKPNKNTIIIFDD